ncbi:Holliday junction resolvase RuvX [Virgibacillus dakarensis]|uniref:Putative pre-16S rRNA nuclease n=1 Tax=Lentibacillus populi TaxID=1827502 RepID=A0A9W5TUA4_9BACI|nr:MULTISPECIES: Holliday junction resolvase RuvX [Bacillaceae]MBT2215104.1 Holliday junction resolvase RuvX [Virgibacillus dakarensis]MTW84157.1 Holliday junction resolvase RuvX [Virgibacillus dakarensis]GGB28710.1 putative pre-16S rRNA nuclease [Lentibacillus populi]
MKMIGLDVGSKTIGVAVSDAFGWTAQGLTTIRWNEEDIDSADEELGAIIREHEVNKAVIGLPKNMNGTIGERGKASELYAKHVEKVHQIPAVLWDERLTTIAAERVLLEADVSRKKRKKVIDKMAAVMILQGYLDQSK